MAASNTAVQPARHDERAPRRDALAELKPRIGWLRSRLGMRGWAIIAAALIAAGLALNWSWLAAIGVAPVLLGALPCVVMCAIGVCMMPKGQGSCGNEPTRNELRRDDTAPPAA